MRKRHQYRMLQAAFVFALVGVAFFGSYQGIRYSEKGETSRTADHHGDKKHPPPFSVEWFTADPVAFAKFALFTATAGLFVVTGGLYIATARLARDSKEASAEALAASTKASETLVRMERPYLFVFLVGPLQQDRFGVWHITYTVANYGKTPAIITGAAAGIVGIHSNGEMDAPTVLPEDSSLRATRVIAAGEKIELREDLPIRFITGSVDIVFENPDVVDSPSQTFPVLHGAMAGVFFRAHLSYNGMFTGGHNTVCTWRYMTAGQFALRRSVQT